MAKMKGICRNEECEHCDEIMEAEKSNFVCEYCGKPLIPFGGKPTGGDGGRKPNGKLIGIIAAAVVVLGGLGYGGYSIYDSNQKAKQEKMEAERAAAEADTQRQEAEAAMAEAEAQRLAAEKALQGSAEERAAELARVKERADSVLAANEKLLTEKDKKLKKDAKEAINTLLTALREAVESDDVAKIYELESAINAAWVGAEVTGGGGSNTINLGWGTYKGSVSGNKSGIGGEITVNKTYTIDLKKASGETVLRQGEIRFADGTRKFVSGL